MTAELNHLWSAFTQTIGGILRGVRRMRTEWYLALIALASVANIAILVTRS